jgi:redox-sensitive bicupin YhaK (pirin superfamily)
MEIVSYVLSGALSHNDSMGNGSVIRPGEVQRMSAGTGVRHSEKNESATDVVHFLQIWIVPERRGLPPSYEQKAFAEADRRGKLLLVGSRDGRDGSVTIHQDVSLYAGLFDRGETAGFELPAGRQAWIHVARGTVEVAGAQLGAGDAVAIAEAGRIPIAGVDAGEVLVFDLA